METPYKISILRVVGGGTAHTTFQMMLFLINPNQAGEGAIVSKIFSYEALGYKAIDLWDI